MKLALFDFDGTISDRDSFLLFLRRASPRTFFFSCGRFFPKILLYLVKRYPNQKLKEEFLTALFKGYPMTSLQQLAADFCADTVPAIVRPKALERIRTYLNDGDQVVVVTASPRLFIEPWCKQIGVELLGSELHLESGLLTGKLAGRNCRGEEKVSRIRQRYRLEDFEEIHAYGDTNGDLPMLALAEEPHRYFKPFR